jgi:hypothetical protein
MNYLYLKSCLLYPKCRMADCKRCGRDIEDPGTMTCSKNPVAFKDGEYLPRVPYDDNGTE